MLNLFNISHFQFYSLLWYNVEAFSTRIRRRTSVVKSRPMIKTSATMPSVGSSSTSSNPGKTWHGYQDPGKSVAVDDRSGKLEKFSWDAMQQVLPHYEESLLDGNAQSVRYGEIIHDGSGKLDSVNFQERAESETFVMGRHAAEFLNKAKDKVRSRQKRMSNVADSGEEHSLIWEMFMAATMNAATIMGKNFSCIQNFINSRDLTLKRMFDITGKLVVDQEEINNLDNIHWMKNSWRQQSLIGMKQLSIFSAQNSFSSQILCCALEGSINIRNPTKLGRTELQGSCPRKATEIMMVSMEGRLNSSGTSSQDSFTTLRLCGKVNDLLSDLGGASETFTTMFNDISCDRKGNKEECLASAGVVKVLARRFGIGQWSFIGPSSEKKWYSGEEKSTRSLGSYRGRNAVGIRRKRTSYFPCNDSIILRYSQE